jgi:hypothetical protein
MILNYWENIVHNQVVAAVIAVMPVQEHALQFVPNEAKSAGFCFRRLHEST